MKFRFFVATMVMICYNGSQNGHWSIYRVCSIVESPNPFRICVSFRSRWKLWILYCNNHMDLLQRIQIRWLCKSSTAMSKIRDTVVNDHQIPGTREWGHAEEENALPFSSSPTRVQARIMILHYCQRLYGMMRLHCHVISRGWKTFPSITPSSSRRMRMTKSDVQFQRDSPVKGTYYLSSNVILS